MRTIYNSSFGWKWLIMIRKRREAKWQMSRLVFCLSDAARTAHGLSYQDVQHRPVGGVEGWGSRGCAEEWARPSSSAGMFGSLSSPACRSCHKALRLEISRILTLQHFHCLRCGTASWLAMLEDQARRNTVVSPPRRAGGETRPKTRIKLKSFRQNLQSLDWREKRKRRGFWKMLVKSNVIIIWYQPLFIKIRDPKICNL